MPTTFHYVCASPAPAQGYGIHASATSIPAVRVPWGPAVCQALTGSAQAPAPYTNNVDLLPRAPHVVQRAVAPIARMMAPRPMAPQPQLCQKPSTQIAALLDRPEVTLIQGRFRALLQLLQARGVFDRVKPTVPGGSLRVSLPFCGACLEAPVLAKFLAELLDARGDVASVEVFCSDLRDSGIIVAMSAVEPDPRIKMDTAVLDLAKEQLPPADLVLGFQPEVSRMDTLSIWQAVITNCVRAAPVACFSTLSPYEADLVRGHASGAGASADILPGVPADAPAPGDRSGGYDAMRYSHVVLSTWPSVSSGVSATQPLGGMGS